MLETPASEVNSRQGRVEPIEAAERIAAPDICPPPVAKAQQGFGRLLRSEHLRNIVFPIHLLFLAGIVLFCLGHSDAWYLLMIPLFWCLISGFGVAIGYHRLLSHRAFTASKLVRRIVTYLGMMAGEGSPIFWVSAHRGLHHPYSDQEKDPHTPTKGWFHAYLGWQIDFGTKDFNPRHAIDLLQDPFMRFVSLHYYKIYWLSVALVAALNWRLALFALVPAMVAATHQENIINCCCHQKFRGYRNFDLEDHSVNIWLLGTFFWGQGFHNNHHRFPKAYDFGVKKWEVDPCRWLVPLIAKRPASPRLAKVTTAAPMSDV